MSSVACSACLVRSYADGPQTTCPACIDRLVKVARAAALLASDDDHGECLVEDCHGWRELKTALAQVPWALVPPMSPTRKDQHEK